MHWGIALAQFAVGFVRGAAQGYAEEEAARGSQRLVYGPGFGPLMQELAERTIIPLVSLNPTRATFRLSMRDGDYIIPVAQQNDKALIAVCSQIMFPPGRTPADVCRMLAGRNHELPRCDYDVLDTDDGAVFCVRGQMRISGLTPASFVEALHEMVPCITALDAFLLDHGYA
jgi:hypothetical protein